MLGAYLRMHCGLPVERCALNARAAGRVELADCVVEKVVYDSESFSSVPAHLYVPKGVRGPVPAIVLANDHGGGKSAFYNQYAGQLYASAGVVALATDVSGEEERDAHGRIGLRAADRIAPEAQRLGRPVMGKMVWDLMRGIDYLMERPELVDPQRIGVAGHGLGGYVSLYLTALDQRVRLAVVASMCADESFCIRAMHELIWSRIGYGTLFATCAPYAAMLVLTGDHVTVRLHEAVRRVDFGEAFRQAEEEYARQGAPDRFRRHVYERAGQRPYHLTREALLWMETHWGLAQWSKAEVLALPTIRLAAWAWENGVTFYEQYMKSEINYGGLEMPKVGVRYRRPVELACVSREERGRGKLSQDYWLTNVAAASTDAEERSRREERQ